MNKVTSTSLGFSPTEAMKTNIIKGLVLSKKYPKDTEFTRVLKNTDEASLESVKNLYNILKKGPSTRKVDIDGGPPKETIEFLVNGGFAGLSWCRSILKAQGILKTFTGSISEADLNTPDKTEIDATLIQKSQNEELKQALFVVLEPDSIDAHGDSCTEDEVRKACSNFNKSLAKCNLLHLVDTTGFSVDQSYIAPSEIIVGEQLVKKGTWLMNLQFHEDSLWDDLKKGVYNGISIGARARVANVEDTDE